MPDEEVWPHLPEAVRVELLRDRLSISGFWCLPFQTAFPFFAQSVEDEMVIQTDKTPYAL
jgi:hypothetical protein